MTIKQQGGIFGRNPNFNDVEVEGNLTVGGSAISSVGTIASQDADSVNIDGGAIDGTTVGITTPAAIKATTITTSGTLLVNRSSLLTGAVIEASYAGAGTQYGIELQPAADNTYPLMFKSSSGSVVGQIYATSSNISIDVGNGGGIDFSATSGTGTSELFDDYEEGTWTVTSHNLTITGTPTYTGYYTKIGRVVYVTMRIQATSISSTGGSSFINGGFPFVATTVITAVPFCNSANGDSLGVGTFYLSGGNTIVYTPTFSSIADVTFTGHYYV